MCVPIAPEDVREFMPGVASVPDSVIQLFIEMADAADPCLLGAGRPAAVSKLIKLNFVSHMLTGSAGVSGEITSERSPTGESVTYAAPTTTGTGLASTAYGRTLLQLDTTGCMSALIASPRIFYAVG